ncbi:hypothetical protein B0H19DRAFT_669822 [Mycena capillaripes]|nr:hypothetical protein B0H19DRAFT_669822 [Mycena capillaripes]
MGNCTSATEIEQPWAPAVNRYTEAYANHTDPDRRARLAAEKRALAAEQAAEALQSVRSSRGPVCSICFKRCQISLDPWQRTMNDLMAAEMSESSDDEDSVKKPRKQVTHGIQLASCKHYFCGACLARAIYRRLNITFDPQSDYGTVLSAPAPAVPGRRAKFPISCPTCQGNPADKPPPISDVTAQLVLGKPNMDEWNHAGFLSTLNLIYCPHKGCEETFSASDDGKTLVQCPRCGGSLCQACKCIWHEQLTCEMYQALPIDQRAPEDAVFATLAKQERWRQCPNCSATVELKYGCNHITCLCKHHFCYTCGAPFEYQNGKYRCTGGTGCKVWEEQDLLDY